MHNNFTTAANELIRWYNGVRRDDENPSDFYCGITCDPMRRMREHNPDNDEDAIAWWVKTNCFETACNTEEAMDRNHFDCGDQLGNGNEDSVIVYLYRKTPNTIE